MSNSSAGVIALRISLLMMVTISVTACGNDSAPDKCGRLSEKKGEGIARKSVTQFLRYAGKTHAEITGDGGTLDPLKLERISEGDLIYESRMTGDPDTYQFHIKWSPNVVFTGTVAANCSVKTNWSIK